MAIQTTQQTGKKFKGLKLLGVLTALVGVGWWVSAWSVGADTGIAIKVLIGGVVLVYIARFLAWWNHG